MFNPSGVLRCLGGAGLTVGLLAMGLELTGSTARARSFVDFGGPSLAALSDSTTSRSAELIVDGTPTRVRACRSSDGPHRIMNRYRELAASESGDRPWAEATDPQGGGLLAWVDEAGLRKSVRVTAEETGASYELLEADPEPRAERRLPADVPAPAGCEVVFSVLREDGTGVGFLLARGSAEGAGRRCLEALAAQGFQIDAHAAASLDGLEQRQGRSCVPFTAPGRRGLLVVAPAEGGARLSLAIHPSV